MPNTRGQLLTLPNVLTLSRIAALPFFVVAFLDGSALACLFAYWILGWSEVTDILDGFVARKNATTSKLGALLDPYADCVSRFCIFLTFYAVGMAELWMIFVFFFRDITVAYMRSAAAADGIVMAARRSGKIKAMVQATASACGVVAALVATQADFRASSTLGYWALGVGMVAMAVPLACVPLLGLTGAVRWVIVLMAPVAALPVFLLPTYVALPAAGLRTATDVLLTVAAVYTLYSLFDYGRAFLRGYRLRHAA